MKAIVVALTLAFSALAMSATAVQAADNTLTAAEQAAGWKLLFDGKTTAGWRGFKTPAPDWRVEDGALAPDPKASKDIMTKATFGDFDLRFDWKISPKGNSGVMFRVIEGPEETYHSGPEYQVLDNSRGERPLERAGALYALYAPTTDVPKPVGEWNTSRIVLKGGKGEHWLNGVKVAEYDMASPEFKAKVAGSKFSAWPEFASAKAGHIALQNHGDAVWYRNIKIKPLK